MFKDETAVWDYMRPRLIKRGWSWQRVEVVQPAGHPDVLGQGPQRRALWIELKEGPVRQSALRVSQRQWLADAEAVGAEIYVVFGTRSGLVWFDSPRLKTHIAAPDFFLVDR